jgi:hypothetical protein
MPAGVYYDSIKSMVLIGWRQLAAEPWAGMYLIIEQSKIY